MAEQAEPVYRSTSQRRKYRQCGFKHVLHYQQGWRPAKDRGAFQFGHVMQEIANRIILGEITAPDVAKAEFLKLWEARKDLPLLYAKTKPWELYRDRGAELAKIMVGELAGRIRNVQIMDSEIRYEIAPGVFELAIPDLYCEFRGEDGVWRWVIIDFKTSDREYHPLAAEIDEQLTDYELAVRSKGWAVDGLGLCVLVFGARPRIQWLMTPSRSEDVIGRFIMTAVGIDRMIKDGIFVQNDRACFAMGECELLPLCYESQRHRIAEELKRVRPEEVQQFGWDDDGE